MRTFCRFRAPVFPSDKASASWERWFLKLPPQERIRRLDEAIAHVRAMRAETEQALRIDRQHEDARNAAAIRPSS